MSKWMGNVLTTLIVLALTSLLGALLKGPIEEFANRNRLQAQVQLAPWIDKPNEPTKEVEREGGDENTYRTILNDLLQNLSSSRSYGDYGVARVSMENTSSSTVSDINFRLTDPYGEFEYVVVDSDGKSTPLLRGSRVRIPAMKPGDRVTAFMWGGFSSYLFPEKFRSYSSQGAFRISFDWPQTEEYVFQSQIGKFLDDYAWTIFVVTIVLLIAFISIFLAVSSEYVKKHYKSEDFYKDERTRFLSDEKRFTPNYSFEPATSNRVEDASWRSPSGVGNGPDAPESKS